MARETMNHDQLFAGKVDSIVRVPVSEATVERGDILECTVTSGAAASTFHKATADAEVGNIYVVAAESVEDYTGELVAYADGYFDFSRVKINDTEISEASKIALMASSIYVLTTN